MEFDPDRFLRENINGKIEPWGNDFELIPFGAGRRICAGIRMGIAAVEYILEFLGTLVHSFDWRLPDGIELDMSEAFGLRHLAWCCKRRCRYRRWSYRGYRQVMFPLPSPSSLMSSKSVPSTMPS
ncbi:hypothetical protein RHGRI_006570 [Rhododendron griersonianum]|uniref:Cytochrome P450 n=1 Tax=Rhododendron griersonianum TaxID=479676 RepID=A0AAV6KUR4_9ERIC|nr:hypothetical protein RHGRI_006570 [Rhododendron griersonianum]